MPWWTLRGGRSVCLRVHGQDGEWRGCGELSHTDVTQEVTREGSRQSPDKLEVDILQVPGAAVPAVQEPGAQQSGRAGAGIVLAFPKEGDLREKGAVR